MATFLFDGDELKECPYNPLHRVLSRRLNAHMSKCEKEPGAPQLLICQFNTLHRLFPYEFRAHIVECPDNRQAVREWMNPVNNNLKPEATINTANDATKEDDGWGQEPNASTFVLEGLEGDCSVEERVEIGESFIPQHQLYGKKPAERKRLYEKITEETLRRRAMVERGDLTAEEREELGLPEQASQFQVDRAGNLKTEATSSNITIKTENTSVKSVASSSTSRSTSNTGPPGVNLKRPLEEEREKDDKSKVKRLIEPSSIPDCANQKDI